MSKEIIVTEGVTVSFGDFQALKGIDVRIKQGEIMIILGPSGSGKSTFLTRSSKSVLRIRENMVPVSF